MPDNNTRLVLRLEAGLRQFERQMERARQVGGTAARGIQRDFDRTNQRLAQSSTRAAGALAGVMNVSRAGRFVLQNTAANIGDIAIQLEQGASGFRVVGQQFPQILGGFGALGGAAGTLLPILGTLVAVGAPLAAMFLATGEGAATAADRIEAAADAVEEAGRRTDAVQSGTRTLRELEDRLSQAIVLRGQNQQQVSEASIRALTAEIEARRAMLRLENVQAQQAILAARERVAALQAEADQVIATARAMPTLADVQAQMGPMSAAEQQAVARQLREQVQAYLDSQREVFLQLEAQLAALGAQEAQMEAVRAVMADTNDLGADLAQTLGSANMDGLVASAEALAERLGLSLEVAGRIAGMMNAGALGGASGPDAARFQMMDGRGLDPETVVLRRVFNSGGGAGGRRGGGGGGGSAAAMSEDLRLAAEIIRQVRSESVTLEQVQAALNARFDQGGISAEEYGAALDLARERFTGANDELRTMGDLLADMAVNWNRAGDIAVNALRRITQQLLSDAITQGLTRLASGPGGGGILGTIATGLFGGARANGGPVAGGRAYLVGERGPELYIPGQSGRIVPNAGAPAALSAPRMASAPAGAGGDVNVTIVNNSGEPVSQREGRGPNGQRLIEVTVGRMLAEGRFDGPMRGRYALGPQGVRR